MSVQIWMNKELAFEARTKEHEVAVRTGLYRMGVTVQINSQADGKDLRLLITGQNLRDLLEELAASMRFDGVFTEKFTKKALANRPE